MFGRLVKLPEMTVDWDISDEIAASSCSSYRAARCRLYTAVQITFPCGEATPIVLSSASVKELAMSLSPCAHDASHNREKKVLHAQAQSTLKTLLQEYRCRPKLTHFQISPLRTALIVLDAVLVLVVIVMSSFLIWVQQRSEKDRLFSTVQNRKTSNSRLALMSNLRPKFGVCRNNN